MLRRRMKSAPHLVADVSGHGFGHVAMTAPVLNELGRQRPDLRVTVRSAAPERLLREHLTVDFDHLPVAHDFGMAMVNALEVDTTTSYDRYRALHGRWSAAVDAAAGALRELQPTLLLANVPYLSLAAAHQARVPAVALCCLHWADVFEHYCGELPGASSIAAQMRSAYASARVFLAPDPSMPMPGLANLRRIGPIARRGEDRRAELRRRLGLAADARLVLLSLGGVPTSPRRAAPRGLAPRGGRPKAYRGGRQFSVDVALWPRLEGMHVLAAMTLQGTHPDVTDAETLRLSHIDLLASCDAVVTKPGYGTVTEAAINGVPMLFVSRDGWPEEPQPHAALIDGDFSGPLESLLHRPRTEPPHPAGTAEAARVLFELL